ncbi:hypothetical protein BC937DRAFT_90030 [Endogone sp. FLAS-F59071]|nr:hypothetical protein BC937DRAFT_90030 [Endogone sp. FLAS-F59071]|eukprot:RUS22199.1 hypothetical protein BC937DRAFT_90030 [Endogone sp. FLAS-F59071]
MLPLISIYSQPSLKEILSLFIKSKTSLSFARFLSGYLFLYKILLRSLTFHPITSNNPALPPFLAAFLASPALLLDTSSARRIFIALHIATKTSQYVYQAARENGFLPQMPWWWGRWLLFIFSSAHLIWCYINDPESFPDSFSRYIIARSSTYVNPCPDSQTVWPHTWEIVEGCREVTGMGFPAFDRKKAMELDGVFKNLRPVFEKANVGVWR